MITVWPEITKEQNQFYQPNNALHHQPVMFRLLKPTYSRKMSSYWYILWTLVLLINALILWLYKTIVTKLGFVNAKNLWKTENKHRIRKKSELVFLCFLCFQGAPCWCIAETPRIFQTLYLRQKNWKIKY